MSGTSTAPGFRQLDQQAVIYLLDTNVWGSIIASRNATAGFFPWLERNNVSAALSMFTIFELSRAERLPGQVDALTSLAHSRVYIPLLYEELINLEVALYPARVEMCWLPLARFVEAGRSHLLGSLAKHPIVIAKREEYLEFSNREFMRLERLKANFPPQDDDAYSPEQAELFAWCNTVEYLGRHYSAFLLRFKDDPSSLDTSKLRSVHVRSLFLFYKYYVHGYSPTESDFMDFANVSYTPYVDAYVTERNALNVLSHIRSCGSDLARLELVHVNDFIRTLEDAC